VEIHSVSSGMLSKQSTFCSKQFKVVPEKVNDDVERFGRCLGKIVRVYYLSNKSVKVYLHERLRGHGSLRCLSLVIVDTSSAITEAMVVVSLPTLRPLHSPGSIYVSNTTRDDPPNPGESDLLRTLRALVQPPDQEHRVFTNASTNSEGENELYWHANTVVWSVGGVQKRRWHFEDERQGVTAACFAWLEGSKMSPDSPRPSSRRLPTIKVPPKLVRSGQSSPSAFGPFTHLSYTNPLSGVSSPADEMHPNHMRVICIFLRDIGHIYSLDGLEFTLNIPFTIHRVWEILPVGILLQAALTDADETEVRSRGMPMMPSLYSLTSPFDELRAIVFASEIIGGFQCAKPGRPLPGPHPRINRDTSPIPLVKWHDKILYVSPNSMVNPTSPDRILVTLNPRGMTLKIFRYVYVKRNDRPGPLRQNASPKKYPFEPGVESMTSAENKEKRIHDLIDSIDFPENTAGKAPNTELNDLLRASESHLEAPTRRRSSHSRNDLSMTLDRMAIGGTGADEFGTVKETGRAKVKPIPTDGPTTYANNRKIKGEIFVEKIWECPVEAPEYESITVFSCIWH
jgi:anaphase-promoting complex subunit 1